LMTTIGSNDSDPNRIGTRPPTVQPVRLGPEQRQHQQQEQQEQQLHQCHHRGRGIGSGLNWTMPTHRSTPWLGKEQHHLWEHTALSAHEPMTSSHQAGRPQASPHTLPQRFRPTKDDKPLPHWIPCQHNHKLQRPTPLPLMLTKLTSTLAQPHRKCCPNSAHRIPPPNEKPLPHWIPRQHNHKTKQPTTTTQTASNLRGALSQPHRKFDHNSLPRILLPKFPVVSHQRCRAFRCLVET